MKTPSPERNVRRYRREGLPNGKLFDLYAYKKAWYRVGQQLRRKRNEI